jgi:hypothetical protein
MIQLNKSWFNWIKMNSIEKKLMYLNKKWFNWIKTDLIEKKLIYLNINWLELNTNCGNSGNDFSQFKFVKNGCLSGRVQTNH